MQEKLQANIREGIVSQVRSLIEHGGNSAFDNETGFSPLILACFLGDEEMVDTLLPQSNIEERDAVGNTSLIAATYKGNLRIAELLIKSGANVNAVNEEGNSALYFAFTFGHVDLIDLLIRCGADSPEGKYQKCFCDYHKS